MQRVGRARQSITSNLLAPGGDSYGGNGKLKSELEIISKQARDFYIILMLFGLVTPGSCTQAKEERGDDGSTRCTELAGLPPRALPLGQGCPPALICVMSHSPP